jgi:hypothetical protein
MRVRITTKNEIAIHQDKEESSAIVGHVTDGSIVEIGRSSGLFKSCTEVTLPSGSHGYILGAVRYFVMKKVLSLQDDIPVYESTSTESPVKTTYKKDDAFLMSDTMREGGKAWVRVHDLAGNEVGFIQGEAKIDEVVEAEVETVREDIPPGRFTLKDGHKCRQCKTFYFGETEKCPKCQSKTVPIKIYSRFAWERLAFIGMWFVIGLILSPIHSGFLGTGVVVSILYIFASTQMGIGKLREDFAPGDLDDWTLESFSWQRFWKEWINFIGVIIAVIVSVLIIGIVGAIAQFVKC